MGIHVSEKVIEDILANDKSIASELLDRPAADLSLLARQKITASGRLDLLYLAKDELLLIELKTVPFYDEVIGQIKNYYDDLMQLQKEHKLINAAIVKYIFVTNCNSLQKELCEKNNIKLIIYDACSILSKYYENFRELSQFLKIQAGDFGMARLGLLNSTLKYLGEGMNIQKIAECENKSKKTIRNRLSVAILLGLAGKFNSRFYLTELGSKFTAHNNKPEDRLNEFQKELLATFVREYPFYSSITYSIFTVTESVFVLAKNTYPVPKEMLKDYFVKSAGKSATWNAEKSQDTAVYIFSNYAVELDMLAKAGNDFFITPSGIQAVLLLQLNRSIKLVESRI